MAADTVVPAHNQQRQSGAEYLQIDLPKPHFDALNPDTLNGSSPNESQDGSPSQEELQSAIGFGITGEQIRLASPNTPAVEKAAALEEIDSTFDMGAEGIEGQRESSNVSEGGNSTPKTPQSSSPPRTTLPSPWRATPKTFERPSSKEQSGGVADMLPDLGRYMPSFNLPSRPRAPTLKDLSIPSLSSILGTAKPQSPTRKSKNKRASTQIDLKSGLASARYAATAQSDSVSREDFEEVSKQRAYPTLDGSSLSTLKSPASASPKTPMIRKSTSDQSLYLRKVRSSAPSLGDDSRWENVQQQVNSRAKAIRDSLQDSNIKLPTLPRLPNISSFLSESKRSRTVSDVERPRNVQNNDEAHLLPTSNGLTSRPLGIDADQSQKASQIRHPQLDRAIENLTGDVVILGGYRGSILRDARPPHRQLWVPVKVGLNIRKVNLEVGFNPEDEEDMEKRIIASEMLSHIGPIDMGRRLLKRLKTCRNVQLGRLRVHEYGWDWRLSPHLSSRKLVQFLEKLPSNRPGVFNGERGAIVIGHSMGGLITRHAVNQRPELFAGVVYAGVPQHCINILGPFRNGDEVLLSSKVLTAQVNFSMRSSFLLLPDDGHCFINKETKEEYPVNFHDPADWERYAFSPCVAPALPAPAERRGVLGAISDSLPFRQFLPMSEKDTESKSNRAENAANKLSDLDGPRAVDPQPDMSSRPSNTDTTITKVEAMAYLTRTLAEVLSFRRELAHNPAHESANAYPPLSIIYANNTPTVYAAQVSSREAIRRADAYDDLKFASGDGVVLAKAAMLPKGYRAARGGKIKTERGHVGLLGDLEAVGKALEAVLADRTRGVSLGLVEATQDTIAGAEAG